MDSWRINPKTLAIFSGIASLGIFLRLKHLFGQRAFWGDELSLLNDLMTKGYADLLGRLSGDQIAPYGYLVAVKWIGESFGYTEIVMRLPVLISGIAALALYMVLVHKVARPAVAMLAALMFATCNWLIYYSAELKPYGLDVLATVTLYLAALALLDRWTLPRLAVLTVLGTAVVWISHPSAFVLAAIGFMLFFQQLADGQKLRPILVAVAGSVWLISFGLHLHITSAFDSQNLKDLQEFWWSHAFMPFPPTSISDLGWYPRFLLRLFSAPLSFRLEGLAAALAVIGCVSLYSRNKFIVGMLFLPTVIALISSAFELYPFAGRLLLFSTPGLLLIIADGLVTTVESIWPRTKIVAVAIAGLLFFHPILDTSRQAVAAVPYAREHLPDVLERIAEGYQEGDRLYVYYAAKKGVEFYAPRYGLDTAPTVAGQWPRGDQIPYLMGELESLRCNGRVWVILGHIKRSPNDEEELLIYFLDQEATRLRYFSTRYESPLSPTRSGAAAYLYEFEHPDENAAACLRG